MAPAVAAALITVSGTILAAVVGVWRANISLRQRSDARISDPELLARRWRAYEELWNLTRAVVEAKDCAALHEVGRLMNNWYWPHGLILSGESQRQWLRVRDLCTNASEDSLLDDRRRDLRAEVSILRSWLKADLNVRTFHEVRAKDAEAEGGRRPAATNVPRLFSIRGPIRRSGSRRSGTAQGHDWFDDAI